MYFIDNVNHLNLDILNTTLAQLLVENPDSISYTEDTHTLHINLPEDICVFQENLNKESVFEILKKI